MICVMKAFTGDYWREIRRDLGASWFKGLVVQGSLLSQYGFPSRSQQFRVGLLVVCGFLGDSWLVGLSDYHVGQMKFVTGLSSNQGD